MEILQPPGWAKPRGYSNGMAAEGRLISLQHRLLRAARAYLDPELQQGVVTPDQALKVLTDDVVISPAMARQEVDRYTFRAPGQATSYFYGYTRLTQLRSDVEKALGATFDQKAFHDAILAQDVFHEAFERVRRNDLVVLTIGDLSERSLLMRYGLPKDVSIDDLLAAGARGDIMAQFVDAHGKPIDHPINRRAIALPLAELTQIPNVIFASGGAINRRIAWIIT